ncbi:DUF202 domain-containing protein [Pontibacter litorisediminis]|uniref:DUF202 domain-containing protein n=1 Tax=Pontibacter litorisediminis TaxID=1846260 RepID=UPI0023EB8856|nr:DUF202 domain-containing protein [Pontibacter litorisediminis]
MKLREILSKKLRKRDKAVIKLQEQQNLEISDSLAMDRTKLANERTLLAYMRTAMGMVLAGLTFIKLFGDDLLYWGVGIASVPMGLAIALFGYSRFKRKKQQVAARARAYVPTSEVRAKATVAEQ